MKKIARAASQVCVKYCNVFSEGSHFLKLEENARITEED